MQGLHIKTLSLLASICDYTCLNFAQLHTQCVSPAIVASTNIAKDCCAHTHSKCAQYHIHQSRDMSFVLDCPQNVDILWCFGCMCTDFITYLNDSNLSKGFTTSSTYLNTCLSSFAILFGPMDLGWLLLIDKQQVFHRWGGGNALYILMMGSYCNP